MGSNDVERKPWFKREDFWTAVGTIIAIFVSQFYGVEFSVPAFVAFVLMVGGIIWGTTTLENTVLSYRAEERLVEKEIALKRLDLEMRREEK